MDFVEPVTTTSRCGPHSVDNTWDWKVNITPKRINSLPYSKIQAICLKYRQRLLDSRSAPVAPSSLPPATLLISRPTPSYVLSPIVVSWLTKFDV